MILAWLLFFARSGFQITRNSIQQDGKENAKVSGEIGENEPAMKDIVTESGSLLLNENTSNVGFSDLPKEAATVDMDVQGQEKINSSLEVFQSM